MFGISNSYYNQSLKKLVIGFGTLFNEIYIHRLDGANVLQEKIRVPLTYGPKEKFVRRLTSESSISEGTKVEITLPLIGFDIIGMAYDPSRKVNKLKSVFTEDAGISKSMWSEVPYNVTFGLYVYTRTIDDNLQIVEQIIPNFTPDFTVTLNLNSLSSSVDIPVVLNSVQTSEIYDGNFLSRRSVNTNMQFTAKTYIYGKIKEVTSQTIEEVDVNFYDNILLEAEYFRFDIGWTGDSETGSITYKA